MRDKRVIFHSPWLQDRDSGRGKKKRSIHQRDKVWLKRRTSATSPPSVTVRMTHRQVSRDQGDRSTLISNLKAKQNHMETQHSLTVATLCVLCVWCVCRIVQICCVFWPIISLKASTNIWLNMLNMIPYPIDGLSFFILEMTNLRIWF